MKKEYSSKKESGVKGHTCSGDMSRSTRSKRSTNVDNHMDANWSGKSVPGMSKKIKGGVHKQ